MTSNNIKMLIAKPPFTKSDNFFSDSLAPLVFWCYIFILLYFSTKYIFLNISPNFCVSLNYSWSEFQIENDSFLNSNFFHQLHHLPKPKSRFILEERFLKKYKKIKKMEKSVDQMNVGRSYPLWDSFLDEKLKKLQISQSFFKSLDSN